MGRILWIIIASCAAASSASAGVSYQYIVEGVANGGNVNLAANTSLALSLYLAETVTPNTSNGAFNVSIIANDGGLVGAGITAKLSGSSAAITGLTANAVPASSRNITNFDNSSSNVSMFSSTNATLIMSNTSGNNTFGTATNTSPVTATTINTVLLGTFTVTAAATPGVSTITLAGIQYQTVTAGLMWPNLVLGGGGSDLYTTDNGEFGGPPPVYVGTSDPSNAYSFTLTTTAVPEPSSLLLCGLAACGLGFAAWRRRKGGVVAQIEPVLVANSGA